jgi:hypothetical protein
MSESFTDIDTLASKCRDPNARRLINEAVAAYHSSAFRAAVVTTWIAVVYDLFAKLRELALTGDKNASRHCTALDRIVERHDLRGAQDLEASILDTARDDFHLLSTHEYTDLHRLQEDRQRCAHPSLNGPTEIYSPSPELVRMHISNAVHHLLCHPPVQGRAALERLQAAVDSDYFPGDREGAIGYFETGPFARMKDSLINSFAASIVASCIKDDSVTTALCVRRSIALDALRVRYADKVRDVLRQKLSTAIRSVPDDGIVRALRFVRFVPDTWTALEDDVQKRLERAVAVGDVNELPGLVLHGLNIPALRSRALARIDGLSEKSLAMTLRKDSRPELLDRAVHLYVAAPRWEDANRIASALVVPFADRFSAAQISTILTGFGKDFHLSDSWTRGDVLNALYQNPNADKSEVERVAEECAVKLSGVGNGDE